MPKPRAANKGIGRPLLDHPVRNIVGLMLHLLGGMESRGKLAEELEALSGRTIVPKLDGVARTRETQKRIGEFASGGKTIPIWAEEAAHEWCVRHIAAALKRKRVGITVDDHVLDVSSATAARLLATGLVDLVLRHAAAEAERKLRSTLLLIETILKQSENP
jgi:hypothetical protein